MNTNKRLLIAAAILISALMFIFSAAPLTGRDSDNGRDRGYQVRPEITLPDAPATDAARAIAAYERLMDRYIEQNERNIIEINTSLNNINGKLDTLSFQMAELSERLERVEKALIPRGRLRPMASQIPPMPESTPAQDSNIPAMPKP